MDRAALMCSVSRALLGEVGPCLRAVLARHDGAIIRLRFIVDGEPSDEDRVSASIAASEVISDFPDWQLDEEVIRSDAPEPVLVESEWVAVFWRREPCRPS